MKLQLAYLRSDSLDVTVHVMTSDWQAPAASRTLVRVLHDVITRNRDDYVIETVSAVDFLEHCVYKFFLAEVKTCVDVVSCFYVFLRPVLLSW